MAVGDKLISTDGLKAACDILNTDITDLKSAMHSVTDGTGVYVEQGYFPNAYKVIDSTLGTRHWEYIASDNTFVMNYDAYRATQQTVSCGIADSGIAAADQLITIADYPVAIVHVDTNVPAAANLHFRIFLYQSNGTTLNHNYDVPITEGAGDYVINVADKISASNWKNDVYFKVTSYTSDSYTYSEVPYVHATIKGFFTENQAAKYSLVDKLEIIDGRIDATEAALDTLTPQVTAIPDTMAALSERAATNPLVRTHVVDGILRENGTYTSTDSFNSTVTDKIKCKAGDKFWYYGQCADSVVACMWFDADGEIIGTVKPTLGGTFVQHVFTAPADADTVIFTSYASKSSNTSPALTVSQQETYVSALTYKNWYPCGDSFTAGEFASAGITDYVFTSGRYAKRQKTYAYHIGQRTGVNIIRASTSGETMAAYSGGTVVFSDPNYQYGYKSIANDADYITLWFGINDAGRNIPIGTIDDATNATFYGAWNVVLGDLITRCTNAHIGIIVSNNLAKSYVDAVIAVAQKWGIPYLDLNYDNSVPLMHYSLRPDASADVKALRNAQFAIAPGTNNHPNLAAHEYESYFIEKWLMTL